MLPKLFKKEERAVEKPPLERIYAEPDQGLTEEQALERILDGYNNISVDPPSKSVGQIICSNVFTYFNLIFFVLAVCLLAVRSFNHLMFLPIIVANIAIGTIQEIHSKHTLDKLTLLSSPKAVVIRDGKEMEIEITNLVIDDIVIFAPGNQICADALVVDGEVNVNESLITGESDEIVKHPGDSLMSGSFVVSGRCRARLEKVGLDSFVARLTLDAKKSKKKQEVGMMRSLTRLIQVIGIAIIPIGIAMFLQQYKVLGMSLTDSIVSMTAALIGMIPEGLYLLVSVALAVSVIRLAQKKTLVHELKCIETLARVDVLCVDKTGTITENEMMVSEVVPLSPARMDSAAVCALMNDFVANMGADNNTMLSLKNFFSKGSARRAYRVVPFSSETKYSGVSFGTNESYVLGAPEFILRSQYRKYQPTIEQYTAAGNRVLLLASLSELTGGVLSAPVEPIALILLTNKIRPQARETFEYFDRQGVKIKVISGDNPLTAADAAAQAGIPDADRYIDATTLNTREKVVDAAEKYTVFGRVTPDQKRILIRALKKAGHTVAMTGDGVNDVLALKEADCSVAIASGSEVASQVAQLVLLDSNFASMPSVVAEGRRVINNIERAAALFLVKNIFSFSLALISIFASFAYPVTPAQLSLINALTIGVPSFFLALEPNENMVRGKFLRNVLFRALPAALTNLVLVLGMVIYSEAFPTILQDEVSTVSALLLGVSGLVMLFRVCTPFNWKRIVLWCSMCAAFVLGTILFKPLFSMTELTFGAAVIFVNLALLVYPLMRGFREALDWINVTLHRFLFKIKKKQNKSESSEA